MDFPTDRPWHEDPQSAVPQGAVPKPRRGLTTNDKLAHGAYILVFLGAWLIANLSWVGWPFYLAGNLAWGWIGWRMRMSSIVIWSTLFILNAAWGWYRWTS